MKFQENTYKHWYGKGFRNMLPNHLLLQLLEMERQEKRFSLVPNEE